MMTREQIVAKFGKIDFSARHWPNQSRWMTVVHIPVGWFPQWVVGGTKHVVDAVFCNSVMAEPLLAALQAVHTKGLGHELHTYDGCFNIRMVRGTNDHFSAHSYGLAIDLNAALNPLGSTHKNWSDAFLDCFRAQGLKWGGDFNGRKDPMHFTWAGF